MKKKWKFFVVLGIILIIGAIYTGISFFSLLETEQKSTKNGSSDSDSDFPSIYYSLTIDTSGQGTTEPAPGTYERIKGVQVLIRAVPDSGWKFDHWSGNLTGVQNPIIFAMNSDKNITAHFVELPPPEYSLTIKINGQGTTDPAPGIYKYPEGSEVEIRATPESEWDFYCWTGDISGSQNPITVIMDSDKEITANFAPPYVAYGLDFSPYTKNGQDPNLGTVISEEQIRELLTIIAPYTNWVRTFGTTNGLENIGRIAHELNLNVAAGAWLSDDLTANEEQISNLISMAQSGEADMLIVGSEVLLRNDLTEEQLINYIDEVKNAVPGIPVATSDVYSKLLEHPAVMAAGDVILPNYYPYWEGVDIDYAIYYVHLQHQEILAASGGKPVIVSESGWPSYGNTIGDAVASSENAAFYFLNFVSWARAENVDYFYFESFDEPWKTEYEGPQGAHWGVWDKDGNLKAGMEAVFNDETIPPNWGPIGGPGTPAIEFTYVPPYGSFDNLEGQVWHVLPNEYKVAVYIKVTGGWWTKPYWNSPLTDIELDGTWVCDITTGGQDSQATEIAAFLVPNGYDPPGMSGGPTLPSELYSHPNVAVTRNP